MRIAWFTPFHEASAIGRYSALVVEQLRQMGHDLEIVRTEIGDWRARPALACSARVYYASDTSIEYLRAHFDLVVYNIGDHYFNHGAALPYLASNPGLAIFHDFFLYGLFREWRRVESPAPGVVEQIFQTCYGAGAQEASARFDRGQADYESAALHHPMTEWIAAKCIGAFVHAQFYLGRVQAACAGPVGMHHLTYALAHPPSPPPPPRPNEMNVLTIGVVNSNKCVDRVIDAIARSPLLRAQVEYRVVGQVEPGYRAALEARARDAGIGERVRLLGVVDDAALAREIDRSDVVCCLRKPVLEGASASAIEGLLSGRPVLVVDDGFYAELPDDAVIKVGKAAEVVEIAAELERLASMGDERLWLGRRAQAWARDHFSVARYCTALLATAESVVAIAPLAQLADQAAWRLAHMGCGAEDPAIDRVSAAMQTLFRSSGA